MKANDRVCSVWQLARIAICWALALPAAAQPGTHAAKPLVLPFQYEGHLVLNAIINHTHPAKLLLDTGADELLLDEQYFKSTGILIERSQRAQLPGAGAEPQSVTVVLDPLSVQFDSISYRPRYVPLMNLRSIVGEKADGVVGPAFLRPYFTEIDFENQQLVLHTNPDMLSGFEQIQLEVRNNRYYLPATIEAADGLTIQGKLQFDLGNGGTVILTSATAQAHGLVTKVANKLKFFNNNGGAGGRIEGYQFRAKALTIGSTRLAAPIIEWSTDTGGALASSGHAGLLGNQILERFRVIFDLRHALLYLEPKPNLAQPFVSSISGMSTVNKISSLGALVVTGLFEGGNADKAGLRVGDRIVSIGGKQLTHMSQSEREQLFKKAGSPVQVVFFRDGVKKQARMARVEHL